ncbi:phospholipid scramblase 2-like [Scaptodrosophila lebanonensis]|uniref:Phospholipid scramblase n=1 Tax=Drosophila lebanonensis TaxID=7225 RepID=A0A6J2TB41_DROLE|nr:phospholipid scramblase 2-like [Scaptodrosophila lebanonensis]
MSQFPANGDSNPSKPQPVVVAQPSAPVGTNSGPAGIPQCPLGLEYLSAVDQLLIKQKGELFEDLSGIETNNKYAIKNILGQGVYMAFGDTDGCARLCYGSERPFEIRIVDTSKQEVIHLSRPSACGPCCVENLEVTAPPGNIVGSIEQELTLLSPSFKVKDHLGDTVMRIEGPFSTTSFFGDVDFDIVTLSGTKVGKISKQWSGLARELFTDADFFGITFPLDLDARTKAVLLGATFLIDFMFFES